MTHIAATTASTGGKTAIHAARGAKGAGGTDFASLVGALGQSDDDADSDADTAPLSSDDTASGDADTDTAKGDGKTGGSVVLDLALGAAAQSAMADTVVATQPDAKPTVTTKTDGKTDDKTGGVLSLDGKPSTRSSWRAMQAAAAATTVSDAKPTTAKVAKTDTVTDNSPATQTATASTTTADSTASAGDDAMQAAIQQALAQVDPTATRPVSPKAPRDGVQKGTVAKTTDASTPPDTDPANDTAPQAATASSVPPIFAALPQAVLDPRQAQAAAQQAATTPADPATTAAAQLAVSEEPVTSATATAAPTGRPVMSTLHRALPTATQATATGTQTAQAVPAAGQGRNGHGDTAQDQGKDSDAKASRLSDDSSGTSAADAASASATPFSDILQTLPPIAQSRIGLAASTGPVTGTADVGATLQGQSIDMGVSGQWIDRMAKEITALSEGTGHSRFQLSPPNLGRIQVDVQHGENGGQVQILTETDEAARRLRDGKADLQADARMSALSINSITIERAAGQFDGGRDQTGHQSQQRHQSADQGFGQSGTQTGSQNDGQGGRNASQSAMQANTQGQSQSGSQGQQNSTNQGKGPWNRDVLSERAGTTAQDGSSVRRDGDRLVRYA